MIDIQVHPWIMFILNCAVVMVDLLAAYLVVRTMEYAIFHHRDLHLSKASGCLFCVMLFIALVCLFGALSCAISAWDWAVKVWGG